MSAPFNGSHCRLYAVNISAQVQLLCDMLHAHCTLNEHLRPMEKAQTPEEYIDMQAVRSYR